MHHLNTTISGPGTRWAGIVAVGLLSASILVGCSSSPGDDKTTGGDTPNAADVDGTPQSWLSDTAEGWPTSDAFGQGQPYLASGDCLLGDVPSPFDADPSIDYVGWGPFGEDSSAKDAYMYLCDFGVEDRYSGTLTVYQAADLLGTIAAAD